MGLWGSGHFRVTLPPHMGTPGRAVPKSRLKHFLRLLTSLPTPSPTLETLFVSSLI